MRTRPLLTLIPALLALAACGSTTHTSSPAAAARPSATLPQTPTASTTPPATTSTPAATSTPAPAATSTSASPPTPSRCTAGELALSYLGGQGATGHGELGFALRNTGTRTCVALGYPGIQFLDRAGGPLPTNPIHTTTDFFGTVSNHPFALNPGGEASFRLGVTHGAASTAGCSTAYGLQVIPPNDTSTLRTQIPGGAFQCQTATVTPLQRGTAAFT